MTSLTRRGAHRSKWYRERETWAPSQRVPDTTSRRARRAAGDFQPQYDARFVRQDEPVERTMLDPRTSEGITLTTLPGAIHPRGLNRAERRKQARILQQVTKRVTKAKSKLSQILNLEE